MTAASPNPYAPDAAQQAANEEAVRRAVRLIAAMYANEGRPMSAALRSQIRRAEARARGLVAWDRKRARS